jgi:hypothetical protein
LASSSLSLRRHAYSTQGSVNSDSWEGNEVYVLFLIAKSGARARVPEQLSGDWRRSVSCRVLRGDTAATPDLQLTRVERRFCFWQPQKLLDTIRTTTRAMSETPRRMARDLTTIT